MAVLYVSDLGGTLLNNSGRLKSRAEIMLNRFINKGILFERIPENCGNKAAFALEAKASAGADKLVCFGNGEDDIPMFEIADECYAVANACGELKAAATGIIPSNEEMGVLTFIEDREYEKFFYIPPEDCRMKPNSERFKAAQNAAKSPAVKTIGTLSEKPIHAALKAYFSEDFDREAKIGGFYADAIGENGIFEIQTADWGKLNRKLAVFLDVCHVTLVYPFIKRKKLSFSKLFDELYRIRGFLTDKNLTVCAAVIQLDDCGGFSLTEEIYLRNREDYRVFLPKRIPKPPDTFTKRMCGGLTAEILEYMSVVHKAGKKGNEFLYTL